MFFDGVVNMPKWPGCTWLSKLEALNRRYRKLSVEEAQEQFNDISAALDVTDMLLVTLLDGTVVSGDSSQDDKLGSLHFVWLDRIRMIAVLLVNFAPAENGESEVALDGAFTDPAYQKIKHELGCDEDHAYIMVFLDDIGCSVRHTVAIQPYQEPDLSTTRLALPLGLVPKAFVCRLIKAVCPA